MNLQIGFDVVTSSKLLKVKPWWHAMLYGPANTYTNACTFVFRSEFGEEALAYMSVQLYKATKEIEQYLPPELSGMDKIEAIMYHVTSIINKSIMRGSEPDRLSINRF